MAHFLLTPEDLLPALALAVLAGLQGPAVARQVVVFLPSTWLLAGVLAAAFSWSWPGLPVWLPLLALGTLVVVDRPLPPPALLMMIAALGLLCGAANGSAMAIAGTGMRGVVGIAAALFVTSTLVAAAAVAWHRGRLRIAWRVVGSWIAASGLLMLGWSLR